MPVIPILEKLRQEDCQELEPRLSYLATPCLHSSKSNIEKQASSLEIQHCRLHLLDASPVQAPAHTLTNSSVPFWRKVHSVKVSALVSLRRLHEMHRILKVIP